MHDTNCRDVILTGMPRAGTTLICYLLNKLPDTVALHEPMDVKKLAKLRNDAAILSVIHEFFSQTRKKILASGYAPSKNSNGAVPDNPYRNEYSEIGLRRGRAPLGEIRIEKPLAADFLLGIKHPAAFTALLPVLKYEYPCYAVVRNPLAVLASWNSVKMPAREGHAPTAERLDRSLAQALAKISNRYDRQVLLLSWYFGQYRKHLSREQVIYYEDIIATGGACLAAIAPRASNLQEPMQSKNKNKLYDPGLMAELGHRLVETEGAYWAYYSKENVLELV